MAAGPGAGTAPDGSGDPPPPFSESEGGEMVLDPESGYYFNQDSGAWFAWDEQQQIYVPQ